MRDYTKIEAWLLADDLTVAIYQQNLAQRLGYLSAEQAEKLHSQTKQAFGCLHGLIKAVERGAGTLRKFVASATSLFALGLWSRSLWSCSP
jgi:hypothetical protein